MNKPSNFKFKVHIEYISCINKENYSVFSERYTLLENLCNQYGFTVDSECGNMFCFGYDNIYENIQSRAIFFLRAIKKEKFIVFSYKIKCTIFDSKIHGELT